jgi:hypothetical protein
MFLERALDHKRLLSHSTDVTFVNVCTLIAPKVNFVTRSAAMTLSIFDKPEFQPAFPRERTMVKRSKCPVLAGHPPEARAARRTRAHARVLAGVPRFGGIRR